MEKLPRSPKKSLEKNNKLDYGKCSTDSDLVTMVDWVEKNPDIFISFVRKDSTTGKKYGTINCYDGHALSRYMKDNEHIFADWIHKDEHKPIEPEGYGGQPGDERYYKLYTGEFLKKNKYTEGLKNNKYKDIFFDTSYLGLELVGNLKGEFGVGNLHGQSPGENIYEIFPSKETPILEREIDENLKIEKKKIDLYGHSIEYLSYIDKDGKEVKRETYKNGNISTIEYFKDGEMLYKEDFDNDGKLKNRDINNIDGSWKREIFSDDEKLEVVINFNKHDRKHGEQIIYNENGDIDTLSNFVNGKQQGKEFRYSLDRTKTQELNYNNNEIDGEHKLFSPPGNLIATLIWKRGKLISANGDREAILAIARDYDQEEFIEKITSGENNDESMEDE